MSKSARERARGHQPLDRRAGERAHPLIHNTVARGARNDKGKSGGVPG